MRLGLWIAMLALGAGLLAASPIAAQRAVNPAAPVEAVDAALSGRSSPATVASAIERSFDTAAIARAVLADHAAGASAAQIERFRSALVGHMARELIERRSGRSGRMTISSTRAVRPGEWLVTSRSQVRREPPRTLSWRVRVRSGRPLIHDVLSSGTSMMRALRNEYGPALRRLGLEGLTDRIEAGNRR